MTPLHPTHALVHYGELALKGRNRAFFEDRLVSNIRGALRGTGAGRVKRRQGRFILELEDAGARWPEVSERLRRVYGVKHFSAVFSGPTEPDALGQAVLTAMGDRRWSSFGVRARRSDKRLPYRSPDFAARVGAVIFMATGMPVNLGKPELWVRVDLLPGETWFSFERVEGPGGLPVGVSGNITCLLSGGIDSPVAAAMMLSRGCRANYVHFHSFPYTNRESQEKVVQLAERLAGWGGTGTLHLVPFAETQQTIVRDAPPQLRVLLYRRFMLRIAERLARTQEAGALVTGESLAQVASQTLPNMAAIDAVATMPVLRPLVGMDKEEIILRARALGTFDTSIEPHEDCCSFLMPRSPATRSSAQELAEAEAGLDVEALVAGPLAAAEVREVRFRHPRGPSGAGVSSGAGAPSVAPAVAPVASEGGGAEAAGPVAVAAPTAAG